MNPELPEPTRYRLDIWGELPPAAAQALRLQGVTRRYLDGATLVQRGRPVASVMVLLEGSLRSVTTLADGHQHLIRWVVPGEAMGVASVLAQRPFQTDLIAHGPCEVLWIRGHLLVDEMRRNAEVGVAVARFLAARLSELFDHIAGQAHGRLDGRLHAALLHLAAENGVTLPDGRVQLKLTQQDMSDAVGASRQRVNTALHALQRAGQIEIGYRRIIINAEALRARAAAA